MPLNLLAWVILQGLVIPAHAQESVALGGWQAVLVTVFFTLAPVLLATAVIGTLWMVKLGRRHSAQASNSDLVLHKAALAWALSTVASGVALTFWVANHSRLDGYETAQTRFLQQAENTERVVQDAVQDFIRALNGIRGTYVASHSVERAEFLEMARAMEIGHTYPGVHGFGFVERVPRNKRDAFVAQQGRDTGTGFVIKAVNPQGEVRVAAPTDQESMVVKYIEPLEANRAVWGLDIASESVRRTAAEIAMNTGSPTMTRRLNVASDTQRRAGFLILVPVYSKGGVPDSQEQRTRNLKGWAVASVVWAELMVHVNGMNGRDIDFEIFDAPQATEKSLLFDSMLPSGETSLAQSLVREQGRLFSVVRPVLLANQIVYFKTVSTPAFEASFDRYAHLRLAALGSSLSVLVGLVLWLLLAGRSRAEALARRMTADLDRLAMVAKRTSNSVVITDMQRRITWVNEGFTRLSGYTLDEVIGKVPGSFLQSEQTDPATRRAVAEELAALRPSHHVIRNRHKDGHHYWLEFEILPLINNRGEATGFMGVQSDVTEQIEAREALAREKERAENILSGTNVGTWESNLRTGESRCNERWHSMMGYVREEVVPNADQFWQKVLNPDDAVRLNNALRACITGSTDGYSCEVRARHKDGHWMWILTRARVMSRAPDGRAEWLGGIHTDITESKQTELDLRDIESFLDRAGRLARVGAWQMDMRSGEIIWSDQTCIIHGVAPGHRPSLEESLRFYPAGSRDLLEASLARAEEEGRSWDLVLEFLNTDGEKLWVRSYGEVEFDDRGAVRLVGAIQDVTRDKAAQLEIERSGELLRSAIDAIDEAFVLYDPQDRLVYCNDKYRMLYAMSADSMQIGATFESIIRTGVSRGQYVDAIGREEEWIAERLAHHQMADASSEQQLEDGRWLRVVERRTSDGHIVGFRVDITSLKTATELAQSVSVALAQEQARLQGILEGTNVGTWEWSVQSGAVVFNERWAEIVGYTLAELAPVDINTWIGLSHPDDLAGSNEKLMRHFERKTEFYECEVRMRHKDGHWIWVLDRGKVSHWDAQGKPLSMSGTHMEITARKMAEQTILELSTTLQNVLDSAVNVGIISSGRNRTINVFNKGAENLLGYSAQEVVNTETGARFFDGSEMAVLSESLELVLGHEPSVQELFEHLTATREPQEWTLVRKNGERFKSSMLFSPMYSAAGEHIGNLCVVYDISRQKEYESSLREAMHLAEQSSVAKSQFLANMSHEIRTPMNAILGMLQLLKTTHLDLRQGDYVEKAKGAARSLLGLLNDILDFSKVEAGKMLLAPEPFDLEAMLEDLSVILSSNLGSKDVDLVYDIDPQIPRQLVGDALRIKQVLINLGGNAVKFTEHGQVVLRISMLARTPERIRLQIAVVDSGIGIAPENQARIFEAFTQAEANTTRRFGGTGLGLVISTRLIRLMGSELDLSSVPGQGSTFSFHLDLPVAGFASDIAPPAAPAAPLSVVLVDDNRVAADAQAAILRGLGWTVQVWGSGRMALDALQNSLQAGSSVPDVVFLDAHMPELDGWQTLSAARQLYAGRAAPLLIVLAGDNREAQTVRSDPAQVADGVVIKPLTAGMFVRAVALARHSGDVVPQPVVEGVAATQRSVLSGMRVLLAEDNLINQQVAFELLSAQGAAVSLAENGLVAVNAIKAASPGFDVVLMDLQMPVMDGLTATRLLREDPRFARLPVIAMTANAMVSDRQDCLDAGMNDHVGKPFDLKDLVDTLVRHTGWKPMEVPAALVPAVHVAAAPSVQKSWPAGLDIDTALARMGGNRALLQAAIRSFVADAGRLHSRVEALLGAGALMDARREMHSFKGLAATLGATDLSKRAYGVEKVISDVDRIDQSRSLLRALVQQLDRELPALEAVADALLPPAAAVPGGQAAADTGSLLASLRELLIALEASDMQAMVLHAQLRQGVDVALAPAFEPLDSAMAELELQAAAVECDKLLRQLAPQ